MKRKNEKIERNSSNHRLQEIISRLEAYFGVPQRRPKEKDLLGQLIGIILSQNTSDRNSAMAYATLRRRFPSYVAMAQAPAEEIAAAIRSAGLYRQKSIWIKNLLEWVKSRFGTYTLEEICQWPDEKIFRELGAIRGIGVKSIAVLLLFGCGRDVFPVDTHVHRIAKRLRLVPEHSSRDETFYRMNPEIPEGKALSFHLNLIRLGRTICTARKPDCEVCPLQMLCPYAIERKP